MINLFLGTPLFLWFSYNLGIAEQYGTRSIQ